MSSNDPSCINSTNFCPSILQIWVQKSRYEAEVSADRVGVHSEFISPTNTHFYSLKYWLLLVRPQPFKLNTKPHALKGAFLLLHTRSRYKVKQEIPSENRRTTAGHPTESCDDDVYDPTACNSRWWVKYVSR